MKKSLTTNRGAQNRPAAKAGLVAALSATFLAVSAGVHPNPAEPADPVTIRIPDPVAAASITVRPSSKTAPSETATSDWPPDAASDGGAPTRTNPYVDRSDTPGHPRTAFGNDLAVKPVQVASTKRLGSGAPPRGPVSGAVAGAILGLASGDASGEPDRSAISNRLPKTAVHPISARTPPSIAWHYGMQGESPSERAAPMIDRHGVQSSIATPRRLGEADLNPQTQPPTQNPTQPLRAEDIRGAAKIERGNRPQPHINAASFDRVVLPGYSVEALRKSATESIRDAEQKLRARAYLTAAEKATEALQWIAQGIDAQNGAAIASQDLESALTAIRESEDFVGKYGVVDSVAIARMVRSHSTDVLKPYDTSNLNGLAAADLYLNWARQGLSEIAKADPLAIEAIRILAHSHRLRDDGTPLGVATSVHLMRAAADWQTDDPRICLELAKTLEVAGLHDESRVAFAAVAHRTTGNDDLFSTGKRGDLDLIEVSPEEFASISPSAAGPPRQATAYQPADTPPPSLGPASNRPRVAQRIDPSQDPRQAGGGWGHMGPPPPDNENRGRFDQVMDPLKRLFR